MGNKNKTSSNKNKEKLLGSNVSIVEPNKGGNPESESDRKSSDDWTVFSLKIREYEREYPTEKAIKLAIKYCIDKGIHKEYLEKNSFHVLNIMMQVRADQKNRRKT